MKDIDWLDEPQEQDYAAAASFLSMIVGPGSQSPLVDDLRHAPICHWRAKDILRAAGLPPLKPKQAPEVAEQLEKVKAGTALSPILLVGGLREYLVIADGYHRVSAAFRIEQIGLVPGRLLWRR